MSVNYKLIKNRMKSGEKTAYRAVTVEHKTVGVERIAQNIQGATLACCEGRHIRRPTKQPRQAAQCRGTHGELPTRYRDDGYTPLYRVRECNL